MNYIWIAPLLALIAWAVIKLKALLLSNKAQEQTEAIKELKSESDKKDAIADASYDDFKRVYDEYKKSKK
jgi:hypothetical protein